MRILPLSFLLSLAVIAAEYADASIEQEKPDTEELSPSEPKLPETPESGTTEVAESTMSEAAESDSPETTEPTEPETTEPAEPETTEPAEPEPPKAPAPIESVLRLQMYLDSKLFAPGKVDGRPGDLTTKALHRYQLAQGLEQTEVDEHTLDLSSVGPLYREYTIREEDLEFIGYLPTQPSQQSLRKYLPYASLLEFLTERFHTSPRLLEFLNQPKNMNSLNPGDVVTVINVDEPFLIEELEPIPRMEDKPDLGSRLIRIDTREKQLGVYEDEQLLVSFPITVGSGYLATPPGRWRIVGITQMPTFRWDRSMLDYGVRSNNAYQLPIGPNNPVGVMWIALSKSGIGIHGTNDPQTIGRSSSHGCIRTANWDVVRLARYVTNEIPVEIEGPAPLKRPAVAQKLGESDSKQKKTKWFEFRKRKEARENEG